MLTFSSAFALVIGMFIIYNCFSIAVTQRRSEIGVLRALGATRRQIQILFLSEGLVAGILGSTIGLFLGVIGAGGVAAGLGRLLSGIYGLARAPEHVRLTPPMAALAIGVGVLTCLLAAFLPARSAARLDPVRALQKGRSQAPSAGENRVRGYVAAGLTVVSLVFMMASKTQATLYLACGLLTAGILLLTPLLSLLMARALRPLLRWIRPVEGALAADSLIGAPRRTSATVAALMCSLALVISLGGSARAAYINIVDWVNTVLNPDLYVMPSQSLVVRDYKFPESMEADLAAIPGIADVHMIRTAHVPYRGEPVAIVALEMEKHARRTRRVAVEGDLDSMYRLAAAGQGVIASQIFSAKRNARMGDRLEIATPRGI